MNPKLHQQQLHTDTSPNAAGLRSTLQRSRREFQTTVFWRDCGEIGVALLLLPFWLLMGSMNHLPWTWYLTIPVLVWTIGFTLVYRTRHKQKQKLSDPQESLLQCAESSLTEVDAQIWWLRNVLWWYILPFAVSLLAFLIHTFWQLSGDWWEFLVSVAGSVLFLFVLYASIYRLSKRTVRDTLEPRRQNLLKLIARLDDVTPRDDSDDVIHHVSALDNPAGNHSDNQGHPMSTKTSLARQAIGWTTFVVILGGLYLCVDILSSGGDSLLGAVDSPRAPEFDDVSAFSADDVSRVDTWLRQQMELAKYPSLSVAIVQDGEIVYLRAFGLEDIKTSKVATPQTQYHVASVTKAFTATLAVILHERGVIDLDQTALKYLPQGVSISTTPDVGATITLRQLASHTSGLPRGVPGRVQSVDGWYQLEAQRLYDHLASVRMESDPSTEEFYSNLGLGLLGHVLECAAKKPIDRLLQELICDPLELERTTIQADDSLRPATGYDRSSWRFESTHSFQERLAGSGGLVTSVEDLAKFLAAQMEPGAFSSEMLDQLHERTALADGLRIDTALGWSVKYNAYVGRILEKNGGRSNCSAWIGFAPEHNVGVAVVTNCGGPDVDSMGRWLLERSVPDAHQPVRKTGYARVAPYSGVRWENDRPIVFVQDKWSECVSVDGIPIDQVLGFANKEYGEKARQRIAEDLVEVLSTMGHDPQWEVTLGLKSSDGTVEHVTIRMTEENRNLLRK